MQKKLVKKVPAKKKIVKNYKKKPDGIKNETGCPTLYRVEYNDLAFKYCLLGATDAKLADFFGVCEQTINGWKKEYPEFLESINNGKEKADAEIVASLYHRARGMTIKETKEHTGGENSGYSETIKEIPPDTTAIKYWLNNRQRDRWREQQHIDHTTKDEKIEQSAMLMAVSEDELKQIESILTKYEQKDEK